MLIREAKEAFLKKVNKTKYCWEWQKGKTYGGYGQFYFKGKQWYAHRFSYTLFKGEIPAGLFVCHKCNNPACVRPGHLYAGTQNDNMNDLLKKNEKIRKQHEQLRNKRIKSEAKVISI